MDGYYSVVRYYLNNFVDGFRQDAFNLFLGRYKVFSEADGRAKLPLPIDKPANDIQSIRKSFLPLFLAFSTSMSVLCLLFPSGKIMSFMTHAAASESCGEFSFVSLISVDFFDRLTYFAFWSLASIFSAATIITYGEDYVNKPIFPTD